MCKYAYNSNPEKIKIVEWFAKIKDHTINSHLEVSGNIEFKQISDIVREKVYDSLDCMTRPITEQQFYSEFNESERTDETPFDPIDVNFIGGSVSFKDEESATHEFAIAYEAIDKLKMNDYITHEVDRRVKWGFTVEIMEIDTNTGGAHRP